MSFVLGIILCKRDNGKYGIEFEKTILELLIILIPVSILSARLYFVLFKLEYYLENPMQIMNVRSGGLAIYGGILGAVLTIVIYCKRKNISILDVLDYIVPFLVLGQAIGRLGNFFNVEAYGTITNNIFRMGIIENGEYKEVHPTFLYEMICDMLIFIIIYIKRNKREYKGQITCMYLSLYGLIRTIIEGLRADSLMLGNIRISQMFSLVLFVISSSILIYKMYKRTIPDTE